MTKVKMPEPEITLAWCSWSEKWEARELVHCITRREDDRIIAYTEAQIRQYGDDSAREALEMAAKAFETQHTWLTNISAANLIRAFAKIIK